MKGLDAIIMAAGLGKRMRSRLAKVLHPVAGRPMILYPVELAMRFAENSVAVVVGYQGDKVREVLKTHSDLCQAGDTERLDGHATERRRPSLLIVEQGRPLGTGHAVKQACLALIGEHREPAAAYLILNGDTPLLTEETIEDLVRLHEADKAAVTILTANLPKPNGYGRVVRDPEGGVIRIVEDSDVTEAESDLGEVNVGTYVVDGPFLLRALEKLRPRNAQREYYLTDIVEQAVLMKLRVSALVARDANEGLGINTREQLAAAEQVLRQQIRARWMREGVTLRDPATIAIDATVEIGRDTVLYPNVTLEGRTKIGEDCIVRSHTRITDSLIGNRAQIQDCCVIREATLEEGAMVGPFAHLRPGTVIRRAAKVGNFVEMKKADLGAGSKANHLSYLGDARIGRGVNIGAGTITCNYDGVRKHETVIEDEVFIGSNTQLIAPVRVGKGAIVAAGSSVTEDVPADALAIARAAQVNRPGWAARRRALQTGKSREALGVKRNAQVWKPLTPDALRLTKKGSSGSKNKAVSRKHSRAKQGAQG